MLKARYLQWIESPQGKAPYFYRRYPKRVGAILKNLGKNDKVRKRLPVPIDATDLDIMVALDQANRDFDQLCRAYDGGNGPVMQEHEVTKAAIALLKQHGLQPGDGQILSPADSQKIEDLLMETMGNMKGRVIDSEVAIRVDDLYHSGSEEDTVQSITVQEAFELYITGKGVSAKYQRVLDRFLTDVGNRLVNQALNRHLHDWTQIQVQGHGRGVATVSKDLSLVRAALNFAIRPNGLAVVIHKPTMPEYEKKAHPVLSRKELKKLFGMELKDWERQSLIASLCMGAINSELKEIKARDLDGTLLLLVPSGKTKERVRAVPISYLKAWKPIKLSEGRIRDRLTTLIKEVNPDASPYSLRHTAESEMTKAKVSETDRAAIMGWSNTGRFHQYGTAAKHDDDRVLPLVDAMKETWGWLFN
ncbi:MAG: hypothetical protein CME45_02785 [Halieaceae bacterium]|nr:hypothetical protein [Halieaceae bacterium]